MKSCVLSGGFGVAGGQFAEQVGKGPGARLLDEVGGGSIGDDASAVHNDGARASGFHFLKDVGREEDGLGFSETLDKLADFVFLVGIQAVGGLIENQHLGVVQKGLGEAGAVAIAFRERIDRLAGDAGEEAGLDGTFHSIIFGSPGKPADAGAELQEADHGHVLIEWGGFRQVTDLGLGFLGVVDDGNATNFGIPGGGWQETGDHPHGGGFTGSVRSEETEDFSFFDSKREVVHGAFGSELFGKTFDFDHGYGIEFLGDLPRAGSAAAEGSCLKKCHKANRPEFPAAGESFIRLATEGGLWLFGSSMPTIQIPERCGVMLLPDCTLFPHGGLPLYIFEPRYRKMLEDALEGDCFFAVARLTGEEKNPAACVAPVGTIGLVRASREQEDGTSQLLLHGVMRVRFTEWLEGAEYPCANIEPVVSVFQPENQSVAAMKTLRGAVEDAIRPLPEEVQTGVFSLLDRAEDPGLMTDIVCQQFIHEPDLRQQLLEMESVASRIPVICEYLRKASASANG